MNVKQTIGSGAQALWHMPWKVKAWYVFNVFVLIMWLGYLWQAHSYAGRALYGGLLLISVYYLLQPAEPQMRMLGMTQKQIYQYHRQYGDTPQRRRYSLLQHAGVVLVLLSLPLWWLGR